VREPDPRQVARPSVEAAGPGGKVPDDLALESSAGVDHRGSSRAGGACPSAAAGARCNRGAGCAASARRAASGRGGGRLARAAAVVDARVTACVGRRATREGKSTQGTEKPCCESVAREPRPNLLIVHHRSIYQLVGATSIPSRVLASPCPRFEPGRPEAFFPMSIGCDLLRNLCESGVTKRRPARLAQAV